MSKNTKRPAIVWGDNLVPKDFETVVGIPGIFRRYELAVEHCLTEIGGKFDLLNPYGFNQEMTMNYTERLHEKAYLATLLDRYIAPGAWDEPNPVLTNAAVDSVRSSLMAAELVATGAHDVVWAVASGQHHAKRASGGGFCALNDVAIAASYLADQGMKVAIIDIDGHAADGTQAQLQDTDIATISVHQGNIFPLDHNVKDMTLVGEGVRHTHHNPDKAIYNFVLEDGAGDDGLNRAFGQIDGLLMDLRPDVIIYVGGADGAVGSPLVSLGYTYEGFDAATRKVKSWAEQYCEGRVIMMSAGGYQPFDHTPRIWANMFQILAGLR
jgi:acetoin utilization protein AcuC